MTITPADSLDLLIAHGPPDATDFAKQIAGLPGAYYAGLDEAYKRRTQDAFQNGLPTTDPNDPKSPVDITALYKTMLTTGGVPAAVAGIGGLQQQANQQTALEAARRAFPLPGDQIPPSAAPTSVAAPALRPTSGPPGSSNGSSSTSVNAAVSGAGFSGADAGSLMTRIAQGLGVDPDQNLDPVKQAQVATAVQRAVEARQQRTQPATAPAPVASPTTSAFNDRFRGEQPAPGVQPSQSTLATVQDPAVATQRKALEDRKARLQYLAATLQAIDSKDQRVQIYRDQIAAIDKQLEPTEAQRNALGDKRPGETDAEYAARRAAMEESGKKFAAIPAEVFDTARKGNDAAQAAKYRIDLIDHSISELGPKWMGAYADTRAQLGKTFNTIVDRMLPESVASTIRIDPKKIATIEDFNKQTQTLGFELAKTLGSREAMQIVQQATNAVPNVNQSPLGAKLVSSSLRQASQRQEDFYAYMVKPENRERLGAEIDFNKQNPPEMYSTRAVAASGIPLKLNPGDEKKVGYLLPGTKYMWNGKPWTKN